MTIEQDHKHIFLKEKDKRENKKVPACICGIVLCGKRKPGDLSLFCNLPANHTADCLNTWCPRVGGWPKAI